MNLLSHYFCRTSVLHHHSVHPMCGSLPAGEYPRQLHVLSVQVWPRSHLRKVHRREGSMLVGSIINARSFSLLTVITLSLHAFMLGLLQMIDVCMTINYIGEFVCMLNICLYRSLSATLQVNAEQHTCFLYEASAACVAGTREAGDQFLSGFKGRAICWSIIV